ncbi:FadR/GntR family transcriptional regulator [Prosthecomicrobium sp. N25]|uniref:FadR/GntR family transcriptional regulator n=1 Tax=Prosthecomicrobium sp. N25 TaxID=3129254 RepID=UPI0030782D2D
MLNGSDGSLREGRRALEQMQRWIADGDWPIDSRVPPERDLAISLGVSRGALRNALARLEEDGQIWRHVGKGTFVGTRPQTGLVDLSQTIQNTSPPEVMEMRLILEPNAARLAAMNATAPQIAGLHACLVRIRAAATFQQYVVWDDRLHASIAAASKNNLLTTFVETLHAVRRAVIWARLRDKDPPRADNPSLDEHDEIVRAIEERDPERAGRAMYAHLDRVRAEFAPKRYGP